MSTMTSTQRTGFVDLFDETIEQEMERLSAEVAELEHRCKRLARQGRLCELAWAKIDLADLRAQLPTAARFPGVQMHGLAQAVAA